jgi:hypothetical protein
MAAYRMVEIVEEIRALAARHNSDADESLIEHYRFRVEPPVSWDKETLEAALQITIPPDVEELWGHASSLTMFMFGSRPDETGLEIDPPSGVILSRQYAKSLPIYQDLRADDLIIGVDHVLWDFLVVVRCNLAANDFGYVFVTQELDARHEWVYAAASLGEFLRRYLDAAGQEYWHTGTEPHVMP